MASPLISRRLMLLGSASVLTLAGCSTLSTPFVAATAARQDAAGLPYHPLPFQLDLCFLTYQLYNQTLVWPFDPYYEKVADRNVMMARVRDWARVKGAEQIKQGAPFGGYRGPGVLAGFDDNASHDPLTFRYDKMRPASKSVLVAINAWTEVQTPNAITGKIGDVYMAYRRTGQASGAVVTEHLPSAGAGGPDVLLAFEGGTGDKGEAGQPASQSMMGFVLLRHYPGARDYDIHIAFRGSRSGSAARAAGEALSGMDAKGNPDWITDLGYDLVSAKEGAGHISTVGAVSRGLAKSIGSIAPQLFACLNKAAQIAKGRSPKNITVTGHSLGGGLAQQFVSAVLLGDQYGPGGAGPKMPAALKGWGWPQIKLVTFSAPVCGDAVWAEAMTTQALQSRFFSRATLGLLLTDSDALGVDDASIVPRLVDPARPAAFRVLNPVDPITTLRIVDGKHIGQTVYVDKANRQFALPDPTTHEPADVRKRMVATLGDPRVPPTGWWYRDMNDMAPQYGQGKKGSAESMDAVIAAVEAYYRKGGIPFDFATYQRDAALFRSLTLASLSGR